MTEKRINNTNFKKKLEKKRLILTLDELKNRKRELKKFT